MPVSFPLRSQRPCSVFKNRNLAALFMVQFVLGCWLNPVEACHKKNASIAAIPQKLLKTKGNLLRQGLKSVFSHCRMPQRLLKISHLPFCGPSNSSAFVEQCRKGY
jgi:hypothetical protein